MKNYLTKSKLIPFLFILILLGCSSKNDSSNDQSLAEEEAVLPGPWIDLIAGDSLDQWKGYLLDSMPSKGWILENGILKLTRKEGEPRTGDIITREKYENFELSLEFYLTEMANSGIFYRVTETEGQPIYFDAPEYQLIDNHWYLTTADRATLATHLAGDNYDLHASDSNYLKPLGEWNQAKIVVLDGAVEHWLNGTLTIKYQIGSEAWLELVAGSKFAGYPNYGKAKIGHIGLQDHGNEAWFRNVKIRAL